VIKETKIWRKFQERRLLDEDIKEDRSARMVDCGKLSKRKNPPVDSLENLAGRKERQVGEALKMRVKLI
jgi:hypothetical protein